MMLMWFCADENEYESSVDNDDDDSSDDDVSGQRIDSDVSRSNYCHY